MTETERAGYAAAPEAGPISRPSKAAKIVARFDDCFQAFYRCCEYAGSRAALRVLLNFTEGEMASIIEALEDEAADELAAEAASFNEDDGDEDDGDDYHPGELYATMAAFADLVRRSTGETRVLYASAMEAAAKALIRPAKIPQGEAGATR